METKVFLVSKNLKTLAAEYGVSDKTMKKWLRSIPNLQVDNRKAKNYTPKEISMIYKHLGVSGSEFSE
ncbi:hypothetical protein QQ054_38440 [Oscillatoria amoena NRMC-F 0135]|nr:hypothetical protein [Oscillatoria amoena NRMC-F 0135]